MSELRLEGSGIPRNTYVISRDGLALAVITNLGDENVAAALVAAGKRDAEAGWRPIETAPRNEMVLAFFPDADVEIMIVALLVAVDDPQDTPAWYQQDVRLSAPLDVEPTHWMPLPGPPK